MIHSLSSITIAAGGRAGEAVKELVMGAKRGGFKERALEIPLLRAEEMKKKQLDKTGSETELWKVLPKLKMTQESPMPEGASHASETSRYKWCCGGKEGS